MVIGGEILHLNLLHFKKRLKSQLFTAEVYETDGEKVGDRGERTYQNS
jgi:hypothetical protein